MQTSIIVAKLKNQATNAVFQMIRDWTVSGLIRESLWLDIDDPNNVISLAGAAVETYPANAWVTTIKDTPRFFALQVLKEDKAALTKSQVVEALQSVGAFAGAIPNLVNIVFPEAETASKPDSYFENSLNLVALPYDAVNPDSNGEPIDSKSRIYFGNCSKELATILGLWPGQTASVLDGISVLAGSSNNIIVERTFVRYVDASSFVKSVISKVVGTAEANLPAPVDGQGRELTEVGRDSLQVVDAVAASFISVHSTLAFNQYPRAFGDQPYKGGWLKALKYYFEWMWNWLRRQPGDILQRKVRNLKLATAKSIQGMLGTNSQIMVAVGGLTAHDNPNGIPPMANEVIIQTFSKAQQDVLRVPEPPRPLELWKDFSEVAMSLIDGSKITNDKISMPEQSESLSRRVVTNPNHVTPNYRKRQFLIPASLDVACKGQRLSSSDPLTALMVQKSLALSLSSGTAKNENIDQISTLEQRLDKWRNENNSFVWIVGNRIAEGITNALDAWEAIGRRVVDVNEDGLVAAEERAQKALTRLFGVSFAMIAVALVGWLIQALWVYNTSKIWPPLAPWWPKPASAVAIVVLIWNLIGVGVVYQAAKHLFQIQHKLQSDEVQSLEKEKTHIMTEIIRLTHFYRQYQAWVAIISSFVHRPDAKPESEQSDAMTGRGIPQSMTVARLIPNITGNEGDLAKKVANEYYQTGWLNKLMQEVLNKQVADFNEITHDNLGNSSYPLAKAMDWATSDSVTDAIKAHSVDQIQKLATQGTAYQSWKVQLTNALGHDQVVTGSEIIGQLRAGTGYMPQSVGFTPQGSVRDAAKLSNKNSACAFDERLGLSSEFSRNITVKQNLADSRELDFLGLRFEATELLSPSDVKIFQTAGGATPANEQSSLSEAVRPDSIA